MFAKCNARLLNFTGNSCLLFFFNFVRGVQLFITFAEIG